METALLIRVLIVASAILVPVDLVLMIVAIARFLRRKSHEILAHLSIVLCFLAHSAIYSAEILAHPGETSWVIALLVSLVGLILMSYEFGVRVAYSKNKD